MSKKYRYEHLNYNELQTNYKHYFPFDYGKLLGKDFKEKFTMSYEDIINIELSSASPSVPAKDSDFTITSNYFFDFWVPILSPNDIRVYQALKRWSFGKRFVIMPNEELMARTGISSKTTVLQSLNNLEENFFILRVHRDYVDKKKTAPLLIMVRDNTPLLSEEQVALLPESLQEEHREYMTNLQNSLSKGETIRQFSKNSFVRNFILEKCQKENKVDTTMSFLIKNHGIYKVIEESGMLHIDKEKSEEFKFIVRNLVSKPAYDTFFENSAFILDDNILTIICQDEHVERTINTSTQFKHVIEKSLDVYAQTNIYYNKEFIAKSFGSYYVAKKIKDSF